jgi:hypothetical protein
MTYFIPKDIAEVVSDFILPQIQSSPLNEPNFRPYSILRRRQWTSVWSRMGFSKNCDLNDRTGHISGRKVLRRNIYRCLCGFLNKLYRIFCRNVNRLMKTLAFFSNVINVIFRINDVSRKYSAQMNRYPILACIYWNFCYIKWTSNFGGRSFEFCTHSKRMKLI